MFAGDEWYLQRIGLRPVIRYLFTTVYCNGVKITWGKITVYYGVNVFNFMILFPM